MRLSISFDGIFITEKKYQTSSSNNSNDNDWAVAHTEIHERTQTIVFVIDGFFLSSTRSIHDQQTHTHTHTKKLISLSQTLALSPLSSHNLPHCIFSLYKQFDYTIINLICCVFSRFSSFIIAQLKKIAASKWQSHSIMVLLFPSIFNFSLSRNNSIENTVATTFFCTHKFSWGFPFFLRFKLTQWQK